MIRIRNLLFVFLASLPRVFSTELADGLYATLQTTLGEFTVSLEFEKAPRTTANFVSLAEGSRPWLHPGGSIRTRPYYNGMVFHRVINGFMIQGGCPLGNGTSGPGYRLRDEFHPDLRHDRPGVLSMANSGWDTNGGQFFITVDATPRLDLDNVHSVFGSVVQGMSVVSNIAAVATDAQDRPLESVVITNVVITRAGESAHAFSAANPSLPQVSEVPISISNRPALQLSTPTAATSETRVFSSLDLGNWTESTSEYWHEEAGDWVLSIPSGTDRWFFRAVRFTYSLSPYFVEDPTGRHITVTADGITLQVWPEADQGGVFKFEQESDRIVAWSWVRQLHRANLFIQTDFPDAYYFILHFDEFEGGRCMVYAWRNNNWSYWGEHTYSISSSE